jgi:hypothetical protein
LCKEVYYIFTLAILLQQVTFTFLALVCLLYFIVSSALSPRPGGGTWQVLALVIASLWLSLLALRLVASTWATDNTISQVRI